MKIEHMRRRLKRTSKFRHPHASFRKNFDANHKQLRLWILRILNQPDVIRKFVTKKGFKDDALAAWLEIDDLDPTNYETDRPKSSLIKDDIMPVKAARKRLTLLLDEAEKESCRLDPSLCKNIDDLSKLLLLDEDETVLLTFTACKKIYSSLHDAFELAVADEKNIEFLTNLMSITLGTSKKLTRKGLGSKSKLFSSGICELSARHGSWDLDFFSADKASMLPSVEFNINEFIEEIVVKASKTNLKISDYPHLDEEIDLLHKYLNTALNNKKRGVNIYIYGEPGTGKTELVKVIAKQLGLPLFQIATEDEDGDPLKEEKRLKCLTRAQALLEPGKSMVLFDETEEVFSGTLFNKSFANDRKGWINEILGNNQTPVIWVSNNIWDLDNAFIRRFDMVLEVTPISKKYRLKHYSKICKNNVSKDVLSTISKSDYLTPAVISRAHQVTQSLLQQPDIKDIDPDKVFMKMVKMTLKAQGHPVKDFEERDVLPKNYNVSFLNADTPLQDLGTSLKTNREARICMYGPPGTGKTSYGHWLAKKLECEILIKKASDLISPYIGQTEKNMAQAFEEASENKSILLIDEVDSFLQDRRNAVRSWEVSAVNEMLTQMESFQGTFIASTNLMDGLDPASLRRFDLKIKIDYLTSEQVFKMFVDTCKQLGFKTKNKHRRTSISNIHNATPGDFAAIIRRNRFHPIKNPNELLEFLVKECSFKEKSSVRIGFN